MKHYSILLKTSAILWIIWGLVHILAGVLIMKGPLTGDISSSIVAMADAVEPSTLQIDYPEALGAIIDQHGFNLFWIGIVTFICSFNVWKGKKNAIFLAAITGGLADLGYFLFMDLGSYVKFIPGTLMTIFSATAIILSFYAHFKTRNLISEK
ncbi:MAG: hypothetical protein ACR2MT_04575 [Aurantibacter sp.]